MTILPNTEALRRSGATPCYPDSGGRYRLKGNALDTGSLNSLLHGLQNKDACAQFSHDKNFVLLHLALYEMRMNKGVADKSRLPPVQDIRDRREV